MLRYYCSHGRTISNKKIHFWNTKYIQNYRKQIIQQMERGFVAVSSYRKSQKLTTGVIPELPLNDTSMKNSEAIYTSIYFYI